MPGNNNVPPKGELLVYQGQGLDSPVQVRLEGESVWLSQKLMAELYGVAIPTINEHIANIYEDEELQPEATIRKFRIVQTEGNRQVGRLIDHYNLEMIIAVGFRVRSRRGSQFRKWANERISEYLVKGFTMDDERLKGNAGIVDYFDELLARIREIRASEARVYLMIKNIFALASDYQEGEKQTQLFFATMQNKMHYAATGLTAAEIVKQRANAELPNMGLTSWKGSRVLKTDIGTAKNYLDKEEIDTLNRITVMFLDQAEFRAKRRQTIQMADWENFLDKFLADVELPVLENAGSVSRETALGFANFQYDQFAEKRRQEIQQKADQHYIDDLTQSAKTLKHDRQKIRGNHE
ncbi:virulence RhuM family protein [Desulfobotulus sp. H1]|uniref:Virulence RhuM family protein n=1 Tax=Desulfobotulus pelophilus TaxID=2823377 RepID=A0ABT3N9W2_9BACT|nr:virulence RhuM family protein [Desulfobotulus pelophilus]MCW7754244.1 virulence RhuM family protein [Desulfobotulus pelophilus]